MSEPRAEARPARCTACNHANPRWRVRRLTPVLQLLVCTGCGVQRLHPMPTPDEIHSHYQRYYLTRPESAESVMRLARRHEPVSDWLMARLPSGPLRVLDVGFGSGAFLVAMAERGHAVYGLDVSEQNVSQLRDFAASRGLGINVADLRGGPPAEAFGDQCFDLVTLFQVVEHLTDPLELLRRLAKRQPPGGRLYLECSNQQAILAWIKRWTRVKRSRRTMWGSLKYPEHLHGFSRRSLAALLDASGYNLEYCSDYAYRDGLHQVEAEQWWPHRRDNPDRRSLFGKSRSIIPMADWLMSAAFGAGSGLYALGSRR